MHSDEQAALLHSTMARTMEADLFDEKRFSDLTVKLANGVAINVHKIVLCRKNEYFNSLCGPDSRFAVSHYMDQLFKHSTMLTYMLIHRKATSPPSSSKTTTRAHWKA